MKKKRYGKIGRPPVSVNTDQLQGLARLGLTYNQMAAVYGCCARTLSDNFREHIKRGRELQH